MSSTQLVGYFHEEPGYFKSHKQIKLFNIPIAVPKRHPERGITLLYGFREALDELSRRQNAAASKGLDTYFLEAIVDVGLNIPGLVSPEKLPKTKMINLNRITVALEDIIIDYWRKYLADEGLSPQEIDQLDWGTGQKYISAYPHLLDRLIQEPEFKHLNVIVYPVRTQDGHIVKAATIFNLDAITKTQVRYYPDVKVTF